MSVRVEIHGAKTRERLADVEEAIGHNRVYRQGTDQEVYADFSNRIDADMALVQLNLIPRVHARILP